MVSTRRDIQNQHNQLNGLENTDNLPLRTKHPVVPQSNQLLKEKTPRLVRPEKSYTFASQKRIHLFIIAFIINRFKLNKKIITGDELNPRNTLGNPRYGLDLFLLLTFSLCSIPCFLLVLVRAIVLSLLDFGIFRNSKKNHQKYQILFTVFEY